MKLTRRTSTTAPIIAGIIAKSATRGPQLPKTAVPSHAPTKPAMILPIMPPGIFFPTRSPANHPIIPPTINDQMKFIIEHSFLVSVIRLLAGSSGKFFLAACTFKVPNSLIYTHKRIKNGNMNLLSHLPINIPKSNVLHKIMIPG